MGNKGFLSNWIVRNLLFAVAFVLILVIAVNTGLKLFTHHGEEVAVPDLSGLSLSQAESMVSASGLQILVADSVFVNRMQRGAVYAQNPKAGSRVKQGRKIHLTINAVNAKKVSMPLLVGYSMRQAKAELLSKGLIVGKLIYVRDIATNNVLRQQHNGSDIPEGTMIETGSSIDLVVGLNDGNSRTYVPNLVGMRYLRATDAIIDNSLNIGRLVFDSNIRDYTDSLNAFVYQQRPGASEASLQMGEKVTLYLTLDETKLPKEAAL